MLPLPAPVLAPAPGSVEVTGPIIVAAVRCLLVTQPESRGAADWSRIHLACSPAAMGVSSEDHGGGGFMRGYHDVGGQVLGPIDRSEHDYALWEKRVDAMLVLLWQHKRLLTLDEHRYAQETVGAAEYERISYYERWMLGLAKVLLARGVITADELARKLEDIDKR